MSNSLKGKVLRSVIALTLIGIIVTAFYLYAFIKSRPVQPTYENLKAHGFYVFVLPQTELEARGWKENITFSSWDRHCGLTPTDTSNPLRVSYNNASDKDFFALQLGPWAMVWNRSTATKIEKVKIASKWSSTDLHIFSRSTVNGPTQYLYTFADIQGHGVDVASSLSVTETIKLIESLEYVGPPLETLNDPWDCQ